MREWDDAESAAGHGMNAPEAAVAELVERLHGQHHHDPSAPPLALVRKAAEGEPGAGRCAWTLEFEPWDLSVYDPVSGRTDDASPLAHVRLCFRSRDEALAFARRRGWQTRVLAPGPEGPGKRSSLR